MARLGYIELRSDNPFSIFAGRQYWDGYIYCQLGGTSTWEPYGSTTRNAGLENGKYVIRLRGIGNTYILSPSEIATTNYFWNYNGQSNYYVYGELVDLLDYTKDASQISPKPFCFASLFYNQTKLAKTPGIGINQATDYCCAYTFYGCTSLTDISEIEIPTLYYATYSFQDMFRGCTSLTTIPFSFPIDTFGSEYKTSVFQEMFYGCTSLKVSSIQTGQYNIPFRIPTSGTATAGSNSLQNMFAGTGGTFKGTPSVNTTYYLWQDKITKIKIGSQTATIKIGSTEPKIYIGSTKVYG